MQVSQGIQTENEPKLRVGTKDTTGTAEEQAIIATLGNCFSIPIDFEILNDYAQYHQHTLENAVD